MRLTYTVDSNDFTQPMLLDLQKPATIVYFCKMNYCNLTSKCIQLHSDDKIAR